MATMPHCDSNVLHAPGMCFLCDQYPQLQQERLDKHINFTGESYVQDRDGSSILPDPATANRPLDTINLWEGNRPWTKDEWDARWKEWDEQLKLHFPDELNKGS